MISLCCWVNSRISKIWNCILSVQTEIPLCWYINSRSSILISLLWNLWWFKVHPSSTFMSQRSTFLTWSLLISYRSTCLQGGEVGRRKLFCSWPRVARLIEVDNVLEGPRPCPWHRCAARPPTRLLAHNTLHNPRARHRARSPPRHQLSRPPPRS